MKSKQILKDNNYKCEMCKDKGVITVATEVHHTIPLSIDFNKRLDDDNLMFLLKVAIMKYIESSIPPGGDRCSS